MKIYKKIVGCLLISSLFIGTSCSDDDNKLSDKEISDFTLSLKDGSQLTGKVKAADGIVNIRITPNYDISKLEGAVSKFYISPRSTVDPLPSIAQDFSKDFIYTVIAQDGSTKPWTIKHSFGEVIPEGFGYTFNKWTKDMKSLALEVNKENTIATLGNYIVVSRSGLKFDKETGKPDGTINLDGIVSGNAANPAPFALTNDDKGNLVGGTLTAWDNLFKVYKWNSVSQQPVEILSFPAVSSAGHSYGRKIVVIGDIDANAYIIATNNAPTSNGYHTRWKVTGGVVNPVPDHVYETGMVNTQGTQIVKPTSMDANAPYYVSNAQDAGRVFYMEGANKHELIGPLTGASGWGNRAVFHIDIFHFRSKDYIAVLHGTWDDYSTTVLERKGVEHEVVTTQLLNYEGTVNGNGTAGLTTSLSQDGETLYLYSLLSSRGITCYELTKYEKE